MRRSCIRGFTGGNLITKPEKKQKTAAEKAAHCLGHRIRVEALTILIEHPASPKEIAEEIGESLQLVSYHIRILAEGNAIELVQEVKRGAVNEHFYRATRRPELTHEEWQELSNRHKQELAVMSVRNLFAENLASVESGRMIADEEMYYWWKAASLDEKGREEMRLEQDAHTARIQEIEAKANARMVASGETAQSVPTVVAVLGFNRAREVPVNEVIP